MARLPCVYRGGAGGAPPLAGGHERSGYEHARVCVCLPLGLRVAGKGGGIPQPPTAPPIEGLVCDSSCGTAAWSGAPHRRTCSGSPGVRRRRRACTGVQRAVRRVRGSRAVGTGPPHRRRRPAISCIIRRSPRVAEAPHGAHGGCRVLRQGGRGRGVGRGGPWGGRRRPPATTAAAARAGGAAWICDSAHPRRAACVRGAPQLWGSA